VKRTLEEQKAWFKARQAESRAYWESLPTSRLLEEVEDKLRGCIDPLCFACDNTNQLVNTLRKRFDTVRSLECHCGEDDEDDSLTTAQRVVKNREEGF
jgi:hypothetical protein